ncbi:DNA topoisomerase IB [Sphingomonas sp. H39-1-10]|uniref:DNA topoisomerase IB n=1 Tax=Sphingomonas pollutisoli TaxID=3030829 RepID=UPI0023B9FB52|nr:DNA topoisomerase IB [Sphingomonas pollutisoli]MDF0487438.1 DNA topoisomerase IB [Sphingomonas pollutisoli]
MDGEITYCDDTEPGITRRKLRHGWGYWDAAGKRITDRDEIDRLNAIGLPPAYRDAWFSPDPYGHIQAVGWDERGRKQYRYHLEFRAAQECAKYDLCAPFGHALPKLRARVDADLARRGLGKAVAVAAIVRLLDLGHIRIGNEGYVKANKSYGATTLRRRHAVLKGKTIKLQYKAKSGKIRLLTITDHSLSRFVKKCQDLPGQHLFRWVDDDGATHPVTSSDVNAYIREAMGGPYTAKHFRTWGASVIAFETLLCAAHDIGLKTMLEPVAEALGNTPAISRKSYVHPLLIAAVKDGQAALRATRLPRATRYLTRAERGLIAFLEKGGAPDIAEAA